MIFGSALMWNRKTQILRNNVALWSVNLNYIAIARLPVVVNCIVSNDPWFTHKKRIWQHDIKRHDFRSMLFRDWHPWGLSNCGATIVPGEWTGQKWTPLQAAEDASDSHTRVNVLWRLSQKPQPPTSAPHLQLFICGTFCFKSHCAHALWHYCLLKLEEADIAVNIIYLL
jgi:hypothetical protein